MIEGHQLSLELAGKTILRDVSIKIAAGEVVALCGPNGAGKSSLLACLAGEHPSCAAQVCYFGTPLAQLPAAEQAKHRVVLEQHPSLSADFTVSELAGLSVPLELPLGRLRALVAETLTQFGLQTMAGRPVASLSGGQRHRAHFARVLVQLRSNQELGYSGFLFLDEPTSSLDIGHQVNILEHVNGLAKEGTGILVVLHDLNLAAAFASRILIMQDGQVTHEGAPDQVLTSPILSATYGSDVLVEKASSGQLVVQPRLL